MSAGEITKLALARGYLQQAMGKTPDATMASALYSDIKKAKGSLFYRPREGAFGMREWLDNEEGEEVPQPPPPKPPKEPKETRSHKAGASSKQTDKSPAKPLPQPTKKPRSAVSRKPALDRWTNAVIMRTDAPPKNASRSNGHGPGDKGNAVHREDAPFRTSALGLDVDTEPPHWCRTLDTSLPSPSKIKLGASPPDQQRGRDSAERRGIKRSRERSPERGLRGSREEPSFSFDVPPSGVVPLSASPVNQGPEALERQLGRFHPLVGKAWLVRWRAMVVAGNSVGARAAIERTGEIMQFLQRSAKKQGLKVPVLPGVETSEQAYAHLLEVGNALTTR